jgi:pyrimidine-specific ribonucleoside hydrolase
MRFTKQILLAVLALFLAAPVCAHLGTPLPLLVDTDMALDDARALALLAESADVELLAVVTSDGACSPQAGARAARALLDALDRPDVPVGFGPVLGGEPPPWREMSEALGWSGLIEEKERPPGRSVDDDALLSAQDLLARTARAREGILYLCLGPLTNLASALAADPTLHTRIIAVYYSGSRPDEEPPSWNTSRDKGAARAVFASGLRVDPVRMGDDRLLRFDERLSNAVCALAKPAAEVVCRLHENERVRGLVESEHFRCWDETVVLKMLVPGIFSWERASGGAEGELVLRYDPDNARFAYLNLLSGDLSLREGHREPVVLREFPSGPADLRGDVGPVAAAIIERHGVEEWNAVLLTNELHRHLGVYSILGAKMGIRARELLGAGLDELIVESRAGTAPPLSCLTDGLQVATGATLGRGTITIDPTRSEPAARFVRGDRSIVLRVRDDETARIRREIGDAIERNGDLTPAYWQAVRAMAIRCWLEMDRARVFEEIPAGEGG